mgnify:CR=1 FL=1
MADRLSAQFAHDGDTFGVFETEVGNRLRRYQDGVPVEVDPERYGWALLDNLAGIYRRAREQSEHPKSPPFLVADLLASGPLSIAEDLKTPPPGAVEGAEIGAWIPEVGGRCQLRVFSAGSSAWVDAVRFADAGGLLRFRAMAGSMAMVHPERAEEFIRRFEAEEPVIQVETAVAERADVQARLFELQLEAARLRGYDQGLAKAQEIFRGPK